MRQLTAPTGKIQHDWNFRPARQTHAGGQRAIIRDCDRSASPNLGDLTGRPTRIALHAANAMDSIDTLIIGAGALGLACAARIASPQHSLLIVEREKLIGSHTSSRNSEVIHAGIYYEPGSLKAELCLEGRERLYAWCAERDVPHRRIGKLLVAVEDTERAKLEKLAANAEACGVGDLREIGQARLAEMEPAVRGVAALLSPSTGIIDSHQYMHSLLTAAEQQDAQLVLDTRVDSLHHDGDGWIASGVSGGEPFQIKAQRVVNAGGLFAQDLASRTEDLAAAQIPTLHMCQGR